MNKNIINKLGTLALTSAGLAIYGCGKEDKAEKINLGEKLGEKTKEEVVKVYEENNQIRGLFKPEDLKDVDLASAVKKTREDLQASKNSAGLTADQSAALQTLTNAMEPAKVKADLSDKLHAEDVKFLKLQRDLSQLELLIVCHATAAQAGNGSNPDHLNHLNRTDKWKAANGLIASLKQAVTALDSQLKFTALEAINIDTSTGAMSFVVANSGVSKFNAIGVVEADTAGVTSVINAVSLEGSHVLVQFSADFFKGLSGWFAAKHKEATDAIVKGFVDPLEAEAKKLATK